MPHTSHVPDLGVPNGIATLDSIGEIPAGQLVKATTAPLSGISTPTYQTVQEMVNTLHGAGCIAGGGITVNGTDYDVAAGQGVIHTSASPTAPLQFFDWIASNSRAIADGEVRWVYIDYNGGTPIIQDTLTFGAWDGQTQFPLGSVAREGSDIFVMDAPQKVSDNPSLTYQMLREVSSFARNNLAGGLQVGDVGPRNVSVTGGDVWIGLTRRTLAAVDTSVADTFDYYYRDGVGGWTKLVGQTQWSSTLYDDGSGTLATITNNYYAAVWIYRTLDSESLAVVFGQEEDNVQATIEDSSPPVLIPSRLQASGFLVGRFIIQEATDAPVDEQSIYAQSFNAATLTDHGQLNGLTTGDDHTQYQLRTEKGASEGYAALVGGIVPDAQTANSLHKAIAGEIAAMTQKITPVGADHLVIEDSADSNNKKRVLVSALPGGGGGSDPTSDIAQAAGDITTTSTTDVVATGMTLTPAAGNYLVWFTSSTGVTGNNNEVFMSIWSAGAQVAALEREFKRGAGQGDVYAGISPMAKVTVNGSQAIEGRWRVSGGTGTMHNGRQLMILKVA